MTKEDKQLLLKDLCSRLPCEVKVLIPELRQDVATLIGIDDVSFIVKYNESIIYCPFEVSIKPYLRPMFSMTEEEEKEYAKIVVKSQNCSFENSESATTMANDWLLSKGFDVRGLISKGLAIEVTEENNPYKD